MADELDDPDNDSEDEGIEDYKEGGYHVVFVGECLIGRYVVLQKLGWGHFSTVWLCMDLKYDTYVAIKIQKSASHYLEAAFDEVEILQKAVKHSETKEWFEDLKGLDEGRRKEYSRDDCYTVQLMNAFIYQGPYGKHFCMVFEILGVNLLEIIKRYKYKGIPVHICRKMTRQILIGLHYLHSQCGIIHTDLKPENVMLCLSQKELDDIIEHKQLYKNEKTTKRLENLRYKIRPELKTKLLEETNEENKSENKQETTPKQEETKEVQNEVETEKVKEREIDENLESTDESESVGINSETVGNEKVKENINISEVNDTENKNLNFTKKDQVFHVNESEVKTEIEENIKKETKEKTKLFKKNNLNNKIDTQNLQETLEKDPFELLILNQEDMKVKIDKVLNEKNIEEEDEIKKVTEKLNQTMMDHQKKWEKMTKEEKNNYEHQRDSLKIDATSKTEKDTQGTTNQKKLEILKEKKTEKKESKIVSKVEPPVKVRFNEDAFDLNVGLSEDFKIKIADLGNGCWTHYHFQPEIQTRQYRGPEVILGINYNETADLWSLACMVFEMLTGDFLFDPKKSKEFKKNDDHLAQMIELLNEFPADWATIGTNSKKYFDRNGKLKKIKNLRFWGLKDILIQRYKMDKKEAQALEDFLLPMLRVRPEDRARAKDMINHYWLDIPSKSFKSKTPIFKHQNDKERFEVIINSTDEFADVSRSDGEEEDLNDPDFVIEGETN